MSDPTGKTRIRRPDIPPRSDSQETLMSDPTGKTRTRRPDIPRAATARTVQRAKYCQSKLNRTPPTRHPRTSSTHAGQARPSQ
jgi:hypothetical protein